MLVPKKSLTVSTSKSATSWCATVEGWTPSRKLKYAPKVTDCPTSAGAMFGIGGMAPLATRSSSGGFTSRYAMPRAFACAWIKLLYPATAVCKPDSSVGVTTRASFEQSMVCGLPPAAAARIGSALVHGISVARPPGAAQFTSRFHSPRAWSPARFGSGVVGSGAWHRAGST